MKRRLIAMLLALALLSSLVPVSAEGATATDSEHIGTIKVEATTRSPDRSNYIPAEAGKFNGHSYMLYVDADTYAEAQNKCADRGGHLATLTSAEENAFVFSYMKSKSVESAYFGLAETEVKDTWKWVTGEPVVYTNWASGEPNNNNGTEDFAMFYYKYDDGAWNDGDFGVSTQNGGKYYICEWDATAIDHLSRYEYELTTALKDGDEVIIYNASAGKAMSESAVYNEYRAAVAVTVNNNKIVTSDSGIVWKVTKSGTGYTFTNDAGETLSATKGLSFATTDKVWAIKAAKTANSFYIVSTTATGSSGDPKYVEWYDKYNEFCTYYFSEALEAAFAMQFFVKTGNVVTVTPSDIPTEPTKNAIIVIPGITGSELFAKTVLGSEEKVWLDKNVSTVMGLLGQLAMDEKGYSVKNVYTKDDSISPYGTLDTYKELVQDLKNAYEPAYDVRFFSYDWRASNSIAAYQLNSFIEENHYSKVILVAHSMGGIVSSLYIQYFGSDKVEKLITLGTPYYGAPKALGAFVTGHFLEGNYLGIDKIVIKNLSKNMPGIYQLLPTERYFSNGNYYVESPKRVGYNYLETSQFMMTNSVADRYSGNWLWYNNDLHNSAESLLSSAYGVYDQIIAGTIDAYVIVGYNSLTPSCYATDNHGRITDVYTTYAGDGTVPLISSTFNGAQMKRSPYFVNGINHTNLAKDGKCLQLVKNIIDGKGDSSNYGYNCEGAVTHSYTAPAIREFDGYKVVAACPINLSIFDENGIFVGKFEDGVISSADGHDTQLYYAGTDNDIRIAYLEGNQDFGLVITGTDAGQMDLSITKYTQGAELSERHYNSIIISSTTKVTTGVEESSALVDADGDGITDIVVDARDDSLPCEHGHAHPEQKAATCTEAGYDRSVCDDCGTVISETVLPALGHDFVDGVCTRCGAADPDYQPIAPEVPGDVNGDGDVDTVDAIRLARFLVDLVELTDAQIKAADVTGDDDVTTTDAIRLARYLVGFVETLRPEPAKAEARARSGIPASRDSR